MALHANVSSNMIQAWMSCSDHIFKRGILKQINDEYVSYFSIKI